MIAEIIATGEEIRTGALADTNSAHIAARLEETGIEVVRLHGLGDDRARLVEVFREVGERADFCVVTGGLGPTVDDLSAEAAAAAVGVRLTLEPRALAALEEFFRRRGRPLNPSNRKQAYLPAGAEMLPNPVGTAPGFALTIGRCRFFFLPGVPHEMRRMLSAEVLPRIAAAVGGRRDYRLVRTLSCFGMTESRVGDRLEGISAAVPGVRLGLRAHFPVIQVKLYAAGKAEHAVREVLEQAAAWARQALGSVVFSEDDATLAEVVGRRLSEARQSLAVAESCTGGFLSHLLTEIPGSSAWFRGGVVAYANEAKTALLGVSPLTLDRHGAVHEETAREMAEGARRSLAASWGLSTTGIAGPSGGSAEKPVGTVCIGLCGPASSPQAHRFRLNYDLRSRNKTVFAFKALDLLRRALAGMPLEEG
ncbi:MAG: competence/damage-inducible protein A [Desulfobacterales bacterium]